METETVGNKNGLDKSSEQEQIARESLRRAESNAPIVGVGSNVTKQSEVAKDR